MTADEATIVRSAVETRAADVPMPPFWGARSVASLPLDEVFRHLNEMRLFKTTWGGGGSQGRGDAALMGKIRAQSKPEWKGLRAEFAERLVRMKQEAAAEGWLAPAAVYGYFPALSEGNQVLVFDPDDRSKVLVRFSFPRQRGGDRLCLADYFLPVGSEPMDVLALQVVTVGPGATARFDAMDARHEYSEAFFLHGLAVQTAEAATEHLFLRMRGRARAAGRPRRALRVGLRCAARRRGAPQGVRPAAGRAGPRDDPHERRPAGARTVDRHAAGAPPGGTLLQGVMTGRPEMKIIGATPTGRERVTHGHASAERTPIRRNRPAVRAPSPPRRASGRFPPPGCPRSKWWRETRPRGRCPSAPGRSASAGRRRTNWCWRMTRPPAPTPRSCATGGTTCIEDLHSTNGVTVNGAKVERAVLVPGCRIEIGNTSIVFRQPVPDVPKDARRSLFASNELLQSLAAETRGEIADRLPARVVPAGTVVVRAGQPLSGMLLVYLGRFRLVSVNDAGAERVVAHVGPGTSFGESALIGGRNADHTLVAEEHSCVFELPKSELTGLLAKKPAEGRRVVETVLGMMLPTVRPRTEAAAARPGLPAPAPAAAASVIIGNDPKIVRAKKTTEALAKDDKPILVVGPAGSGKKTFARHFHRSGTHASEGVQRTVDSRHGSGARPPGHRRHRGRGAGRRRGRGHGVARTHGQRDAGDLPRRAAGCPPAARAGRVRADGLVPSRSRQGGGPEPGAHRVRRHRNGAGGPHRPRTVAPGARRGARRFAARPRPAREGHPAARRALPPDPRGEGRQARSHAAARGRGPPRPVCVAGQRHRARVRDAARGDPRAGRGRGLGRTSSSSSRPRKRRSRSTCCATRRCAPR